MQELKEPLIIMLVLDFYGPGSAMWWRVIRDKSLKCYVTLHTHIRHHKGEMKQFIFRLWCKQAVLSHLSLSCITCSNTENTMSWCLTSNTFYNGQSGWDWNRFVKPTWIYSAYVEFSKNSFSIAKFCISNCLLLQSSKRDLI